VAERFVSERTNYDFWKDREGQMTRTRLARRFEGPLKLCLVGIAVLALAACDRGDAKASKQAPAAPTQTVIVAEVVQRAVGVGADFVARTEGVPTVELRARVSGVLEQVRFREGSEVKQGQTLFVIQQDEYKAALQSAKAQLAKAEADLVRARDTSVVERAKASLDQAKADLGKDRADVARYRPLVEQQAIPKQDLDTALSREQASAASVAAAEAALKDSMLSQRTAIQLAEAAVESGKAAVTQADLNVKYTTIESPINGIISKLNVDTGNLVGKNEPTLLATVSAIDPIFVDSSISEADYLRLVKRFPGLGRGQVPPGAGGLELILGDGTVHPQKGRLVFVDRAIDQKTGTIQVRSEFPNPQHVLRPGQFGRVRAITEEVPDAILVPQVAVQDLQGAKTVMVVGEDGKVAMRTVTLRQPYQDFYIVGAGVKAGERVIVEGLQKVRPGVVVKAELKPAGAGKSAPAGAQPPATAPPAAPAPAAPPAAKPKSGG
jgi:membrane fusion protein (multidrug efflux system)